MFNNNSNVNVNEKEIVNGHENKNDNWKLNSHILYCFYHQSNKILFIVYLVYSLYIASFTYIITFHCMQEDHRGSGVKVVVIGAGLSGLTAA